jgi:nucleoside-diphosphate-sugar epimerase
MAKVLVTGASGFIGAKLSERLVARGDDVTCLVRPTSNRTALDPLGVRYAWGDVRDADAMRSAVAEADTVFHLAGLATAFSAQDLMRVNCEGFRNVAKACAECETPPVLISVSSLAAAGPSPPGRQRTESDPAEPVSNYGRAKRAAELVAEQFADRVPITIVRPPIVFGEGDTQMRNVFRSIFRYGVHLALGVAASHYSLIHVDDLCDSLIACADGGKRLAPAGSGAATNPPQGYYFVAADEQPTFAELGRLIGKSLGRQSVRVLKSKSTASIWTAAAIAEGISRLRGQPYILNFDKVREAKAGDWVCSPLNLRRDLRIAPRVSVLDRLRQTSNWYLQQKWL